MTSTDRELELNMVTYRDLLRVPVQDNGRPLIALDDNRIQCTYRPPFMDMKDALKGKMQVRDTVAERLYNAARMCRGSSLTLEVCYGYRSPSIQKARFAWIISQLSKEYYEDPYELYEAAHRRVAVPSVAGHPTGGAVDVTIKDITTGKDLDFGSTMYDYTTKQQYVFAPDITSQQRRNRMMLRACMMEAGFAPFNGEWWHFSYGDREWAYYYARPTAIFGQIGD